MDTFSIHVYGERSSIPPTLRAPAHDDDRDRRLPQARDAARQRVRRHRAAGPKLPIVYGEYGVETTIPPDKASLYTGREVVPTVDEQTQASYYVEAIHAAERQPNVRMLFLFHVVDESGSKACRARRAMPTAARSRAQAKVQAALEGAH